ncbi:MbcA/ParS/Xre antitoxin family protein [Pectobacterium fontis]|uniref:MbcA/ParS/Xre antitoxin family protein n=1 Tax=Pectobacterium fontis TaxID=2558042 RepID=UPI00068ECB34|nr:MbcA/ParS/Xre antitoxin family protein [Pectobacterium fontis]
MKNSGRNPTMIDIVNLKKMTPIQRKIHEMTLLKTSFDDACKKNTLRSSLISERAIELFEGDADLAKKWLAEPNRALEWISPNEMLSLPSGIDAVLKLITQLQHGVYP